jgi:hypothetical protein
VGDVLVVAAQRLSESLQYCFLKSHRTALLFWRRDTQRKLSVLSFGKVAIPASVATPCGTRLLPERGLRCNVPEIGVPLAPVHMSWSFKGDFRR